MDENSLIRLSIFFGVFSLMALLELAWPARHAALKRRYRWQANLSVVVIGAIVARLILPATLAGVAIFAQDNQLGLFHHLVPPPWLAIVLGVLWLDCVIYWQHRLFHRVPVLWRIHRMHHADSHVDTTTGLRFHPVEIMLSLGIKAAAILLLGVPALAVVIFEVALNAFSIFNHSNIRLPQNIDDKLARLVITQRLHRIHHSQYAAETNSNFGFSVSWWDKLFGSFKARAQQPDENLDIGQQQYPPSKYNSSLWRLLTMPLDKPATDTKSAAYNAIDDSQK